MNKRRQGEGVPPTSCSRGPRMVFVAGLHRTGTSLIAQLLAAHPNVSGIKDAPVPANEGCYLQGAIAHLPGHGIPGHYATDPAQHLIEGCCFDTLATRERMLADWGRWFDPLAQFWVEKSPVNLVRMRLYQQLFPTAQFVVVLRHPEAMAAALAKWTDRPAAALIDYALDAYALMEADLAQLHWAMVVRYENLVRTRGATLAALLRFLNLTPIAPVSTLRDGNADYAGCTFMNARQAARAARWGYRANLECEPFAPIMRHPLRAARKAAASEFGDQSGLAVLGTA